MIDDPLEQGLHPDDYNSWTPGLDLHDYKFGEGKLDLSFRQLPATLRHERIREVSKWYCANLDRALAICTVPADMVFFSKMDQICFDWAYSAVIGRADLRPCRHVPELQQKVTEYADFVLQSWMQMEIGLSDAKRANLHWNFALDAIKMIAARGTYVGAGLEALMTSNLIAVWTAFEALAGDLWECALNVHPQTLAALRGRAKLIEKKAGTSLAAFEDQDDEDSTGQTSASPGKQILLDDITRITQGTYSVTECMGTILRRRQKFTTLTGIRRAYSLAFSKRFDGVVSALADQSLDALCIVRNLIVHKAGKADRIYVDEASNVPSAPRLAIGEQLRLDGHKLAGLIDPVMRCGKSLLIAVDDWVTHRDEEKQSPEGKSDSSQW